MITFQWLLTWKLFQSSFKSLKLNFLNEFGKNNIKNNLHLKCSTRKVFLLPRFILHFSLQTFTSHFVTSFLFLIIFLLLNNVLFYTRTHTKCFMHLLQLVSPFVFPHNNLCLFCYCFSHFQPIVLPDFETLKFPKIYNYCLTYCSR